MNQSTTGQFGPGIEIHGPVSAAFAEILTPEALTFIANLHRTFNPTRCELLLQRTARQHGISAGARPDFLVETAAIRGREWQVAPIPADLQLRRVEITGPTERKMMINALNSSANVFMADCEDALSPTWENAVQGQINLKAAVLRTLSFDSPEGKHYQLNDTIATLLVRPRGWHLTEKHVLVDGGQISASLFDFGLYIFHNAAELISRGSGPYFYLPKLENHREARLWNDVFNAAQATLGLAPGTIKATVLIETILAAFEMDEILYELKEHAAGLNAGRWDYIFSAIKKFQHQSGVSLPDRAQITMTVPFMRAYTELMVKTCHQRGAHAIGGMAAFIPSRRDAEVNKVALAKVSEDKQREAGDGFDGTWVAHPDLAPVARQQFDAVLGDQPHQKHRLREDVSVTAAELADIRVPGGQISAAGLRNNISVALQYLGAWLEGNGAVAIFNLMEDTATAEISRAQLWQWIRAGATLSDGTLITSDLYRQERDAELAALHSTGLASYTQAAELLDQLVLSEEFIEFLTIPAYELLD